MKKVFTSISMALCLVASSFTTSAQTVQLSEAQKTEIQKEVLPVVFEQIKEQTGLDILGWAQPQLSSDFIGSLPVLNNLQSGLRADTPTPYSVKPDSVVVNIAAIPGLPSMAGVLGNVKVEFENYATSKFPFEINGRALEIEMPGVIKAISSTLGTVAEIVITSSAGAEGGLPIKVDMTISLFEGDAQPLLGFAFEQNATTYALEASLEIRDGLKDIWDLIKGFSPELPALPELNYLVSIDIAGLLTTGALPVSLYGVPTATTTMRIPMGDAAVALDFSGKMPIKYIGLTSYEDAVAKGWRKLWFNMEQKTIQDIVLTIDNYVYKTEAKVDSTLADKTIITMSDYTKSATMTSSQSAMKSVIDRVVSELATEGKASWYKMLVESGKDSNKDGRIDNDEKVTTMEIEVTPSIVGADAIANINIKSYSFTETEDVITTEMDVKATANLTNQVIKVDVIPAGSPVAVGSAYFTSNIAGIVTSNDDITINTVKVTPVDGGIYIDNSEKATYRIVNMSGATIANGTVSGDNAYISTSSLAKGVYVIVVTENGVSQSVKFAR